MGYDICIEREKAPISREEWKALIARDPELRIIGSKDDEYLSALYIPKDRELEYLHPFIWLGGKIWNKKPRRSALQKCWRWQTY